MADRQVHEPSPVFRVSLENRDTHALNTRRESMQSFLAFQPHPSAARPTFAGGSISRASTTAKTSTLTTNSRAAAATATATLAPAPFSTNAGSYGPGLALFSLSPNAWEYPTVEAAAVRATSSDYNQGQQVFDPVLPDSGALLGMAAILVLSIVAVRVWATQVVPVSRTNLAISKRNGKVREYLDDLLALDVDVDLDDTGNETREAVGQAAARGAGSRDEGNLKADAAGAVMPSSTMRVESHCDESRVADERHKLIDAEEAAASRVPVRQDRGRQRAFERWLFSDWLSQVRSRNRKGERAGVPRGRPKDPAIPVLLPNAKWNSGDNPVLVASALIAIGVVVSSIVENVLP